MATETQETTTATTQESSLTSPDLKETDQSTSETSEVKETPKETKTDTPDVEAPDTETKQKVDDDKSDTKPTSKEADKESESTDDADKDPDARVVPAVSEYKLPEGVPQQVAQFAHDNDMTQSQLDSTLNTFGGYLAQTEKVQRDTLRSQGEEHVKAWGKDADYKLSLVRRALKQTDSSGKVAALLEESGYGNHPVILEFFHDLGNSMREGGYLKGSVNTPKQKRSAAQSMFSNHPSSS